jgi:hypothetical protein
MNQKFRYILRISEKAKRVRFQVSAEKGLEIVVPKRMHTFGAHKIWVCLKRSVSRGNPLPERL